MQMRYGKLGISAAMVCVFSFAGSITAETIIKDHVSDPATWAEDVGGLLDHFIDPDPFWSGVAAIAVTGNGERLSKVGVVWSQSSLVSLNPADGDIHELRWRFRYFASTVDFSLAAMYVPADHPSHEAIFETPSNPDWTVVIGSFLGMFEYRYAEVDVSHLSIVTTPGQTHLVVLVPESRLEIPETVAAIAAGGGIGAIIGTESDWYDGNNLAPGLEPASLAELHANPDAFINWDYVAGRVVTEPTGPCALPPTDASADRLMICPGGAVQLSATPGMGGDTVDWFTGACGDLPAGSGTSITVSPASDSTYFARTRNAATGCVSEACIQVGPVVVKAYARADFNRDCAVDELDLMIFTACASGPHIPYDTAQLPEPPPGCTLVPDPSGRIAADLDADRDVDQVDFGILQRCYFVAGMPGDPECRDSTGG